MGVYIGERTQSYAAMQGPCNSGFHIPTKDELNAIIDAGVSLGAWARSGGGNNFSTYLHIPPAAWRSQANGNPYTASQGASGGIWTCTGTSTESYVVTYTNSGSYADINTGTIGRAYGYSIRPIKDTPTIPDSGWTTVYSGAGSSGIFRSSSLGLISISSDGTTWYTIADKNLGATTAWSSGDTLFQANCGNYYQRGNNYGFPFTGSITTSSTKVNASTYGPGNYYSSSTFITSSSSPYNWDSSANADLWGGKTGIVNVAQELYAAYIGEWYVVPTSISLDKSSISLTTVGQTEQLTATILPADAKQTVTWTSNNTSIATVDQTGLVTCVTPGDATITATTVNGLTATCTVKEYTITTYSIDLANSSITNINNAGWSCYNSSISFNSRGAYWSGRRNDVSRNISNLSSYKKAVITSYIKVVTGGWYGDIYFGNFKNSTTEPNKSFFQGKMYTYNGSGYQGILITRNDSQYAITVVPTPSGYYTGVTELDLTTGLIKLTISGDASGSVQYTMSSNDLALIKSTHHYLGAGFEAASSGNGTKGHNLMTVRIDLYS